MCLAVQDGDVPGFRNVFMKATIYDVTDHRSTASGIARAVYMRDGHSPTSWNIPFLVYK